MLAYCNASMEDKLGLLIILCRYMEVFSVKRVGSILCTVTFDLAGLKLTLHVSAYLLHNTDVGSGGGWTAQSHVSLTYLYKKVFVEHQAKYK